MLGQATMCLCGSRTWTWTAGPVGLSGMLLIAVPALHVPGRCETVALILLVVLLAAAAGLCRDPRRLPPQAALAAIPLALLVWVPFVSAGHAGTLGVNVDNDMSAHLLWAEAYRSEAVAAVTGLPPWYPLGPHALVAVISTGLDVETDYVFGGLTAAIPILIGLTALGLLSPCADWLARVVVSTVVGLPSLVAGYYGQGSFKELAIILITLGFVIELRRFDPAHGLLRWIPSGILAAGALSVYSLPGLVWPAGIATVWLVGLGTVACTAAADSALCSRSSAANWSRRSSLSAQSSRFSFRSCLGWRGTPRKEPVSTRASSGSVRLHRWGISRGPCHSGRRSASGMEATTGWHRPTTSSHRLCSSSYSWVPSGGCGGDWLVPCAAGACVAIWVLTNHSYSPYLAAKALVILTPFVILTALRPMMDWSRDLRTQGWLALAGSFVAALVVVGLVGSSWSVLRYSSVGPRDHLGELRSLRTQLSGEPTLFLGYDDFIRWELAGVPVKAPVVGDQELPIRPEKQWVNGRAHDIDSVYATTLNRFRWIITPRDALASQMPRQMRLVRRTASFALYMRVAPVPRRELLVEGEAPAVTLDCGTTDGRRISRARGEASIRRAFVGGRTTALAPGATEVVKLRLAAGVWDLSLDYSSPRQLRITAPGLRTTMPANLDRSGPRWPVGRIAVNRFANGRGAHHLTCEVVHACECNCQPRWCGRVPGSRPTRRPARTSVWPARRLVSPQFRLRTCVPLRSRRRSD